MTPAGDASPRRGDVWATNAGVAVLVVSSTVYNEIPSEPTVVFVTSPTLASGWMLVMGGPLRG